MIAKAFGTILLAGAAATAVAFAPTAAATVTTEWQAFGLTPTCSSTGQADTTTGMDSHTTGAGYWPFNGGPNPPAWVLQ